MVTPSSIVGSIGVVMVHIDQSRKLDKQGVTPTLIFMGDHKVDGHSFGPLPDSVKVDVTAELSKFYGMFVGTVARFRDMKADAVKATQARCYMGADAVKARLADAVGTLDDAVGTLDDALAGAGGSQSGPAPSFALGPIASRPAPTAAPPAKPLTSAELRKLQVDTLAGAWRTKGRAYAASLGFPADVMAEIEWTMQAAADSAWSDVAATVTGAAKPTPAAGTSAAAADPWGDVVAKLNADHGLSRQDA